MPKYNVPIEFVGSTTIEVEADSPEEAEDKALNDAPQNDFGYAEWYADEWYVSEDMNNNSLTRLVD